MQVDRGTPTGNTMVTPAATVDRPRGAGRGSGREATHEHRHRPRTRRAARDKDPCHAGAVPPILAFNLFGVLYCALRSALTPTSYIRV